MRFHADVKNGKISIFKGVTEVNNGAKQTIYLEAFRLEPAEALDLAEALLQGHQQITNRVGKPAPTPPPEIGIRTQTSRW